MISVLHSLLLTLRTLTRSRADLQLEILALRHQLAVLQRSRLRRVRLAKADRWLWVLLSRLWTRWRTALVSSSPRRSSHAPTRFPHVVDLEKSASRPATDCARQHPHPDSRHGRGEPALGRAA